MKWKILIKGIIFVQILNPYKIQGLFVQAQYVILNSSVNKACAQKPRVPRFEAVLVWLEFCMRIRKNKKNSVSNKVKCRKKSIKKN